MNHPFDELSKSLADESVPRRESLRRLGLVITGALLGPLAIVHEAAADGSISRSWGPPLRRITTQRSTQRRTDQCLKFCKCRNTKQQSQCLSACRACEGNTSNIRGRCGTYTCIDLTSDVNCGTIGNNCTVSGKTCCGGTCRDVSSDNTNCGACGVVCGGATPFCIAGICTAGGSGCGTGLTKCGTSCVNLSTDAANCGACYVACASGSTCVNGTCSGEVECGPGLTRCFYGCTDLNFDPSNCGACGHQCGSGDGCSFGSCSGTCSGCGF
jgi:hypothetical protein